VERADELTELVLGSEWLTHQLQIVAALGLPDCWIGAGAVRDLVWDTRFGAGFDPANVEDVDVVFFDPDDLSADHEHDIERRLREQEPSVDWDVKNQARVHLWYEARFGGAAQPLTSTTDGVSTWPEIATAVAVRFRSDASDGSDDSDGTDRLDITAPFGLDDLLDGVWRRNLNRGFNRVTDADYRARIVRKQPHVRWPGLVVLEEPTRP
jgi:hypothetical protein